MRFADHPDSPARGIQKTHGATAPRLFISSAFANKLATLLKLKSPRILRGSFVPRTGLPAVIQMSCEGRTQRPSPRHRRGWLFYLFTYESIAFDAAK